MKSDNGLLVFDETQPKVLAFIRQNWAELAFRSYMANRGCSSVYRSAICVSQESLILPDPSFRMVPYPFLLDAALNDSDAVAGKLCGYLAKMDVENDIVIFLGVSEEDILYLLITAASFKVGDTVIRLPTPLQCYQDRISGR